MLRNELVMLAISIHAPREGSDGSQLRMTSRTDGFQSTLPARGATARRPLGSGGSDDFNPRSPRGERQITASLRQATWRFQSTLPARGATLRLQWLEDKLDISIHAPREGSDFAAGGRPEKTLISIHAPREGSDDDLYHP